MLYQCPFLVLILYGSPVKCNLWENWMQGTWTSVLPLQLPMNLQLFQSKKLRRIVAKASKNSQGKKKKLSEGTGSVRS